MKEAGTVEITVELTLGSETAVKYLISRFGMRSRALGSMSEPEFHVIKAGPWDYKVTVRFRHTCRNRGSANSDARRFVHNAMKTGHGRVLRHDIGIVRVRPWQPVEVAV